MMEPFPEWLKGMHHKTYWRLREQHDEAEMAQLAGMREWLDRVEKKTGLSCLRVCSAVLRWPVETGRRTPPREPIEPPLRSTRFDE